jgi:hypothetical protein
VRARALIGLGGILLGATRVVALPTCPPPVAPTLWAAPRYGAAPAILVNWTAQPLVVSYELWRVANGVTLTRIATPGPAVTSYQDNAVDTASTYQYEIRACLGAPPVCTPFGTFTTSVTVAWPISGGHEVLHGFNEIIGWAGIRSAVPQIAAGYHDGVDLNKTTIEPFSGDDVRAPRGGVVDTIIDSAVADDSFVSVKVDVGVDALGNPMYEWDGFNHIANDGSHDRVVCMGDFVAPGTKLAQVGTRHFDGDFTDHVHSMVTTVAAVGQTSARHFLTIFTDPADRDPQGLAPTLFDENDDGKVVLFRDHNDPVLTNYLDYDHDAKPLSGDLDIEVEVTDQQGTNPRQAPIRLKYWIEGPLPAAEASDDVKSTAHPYWLYDFQTNYFGAGTPTNCMFLADIQDAANSGCKGLNDCVNNPMNSGAACNSVITEGILSTTYFPWPVLHHFIITDTKGENGARTNTDGTQYWRTKAMEDGGNVEATTANYAGMPLASKPSDARFPDGDYDIHVLASDLVHADVDLVSVMFNGTTPLQHVRLENYTPFIKEIDVYDDADGNPTTQVDADHPGCERQLYKYKHTNPNPYPGANYLTQAQSESFATALHTICVRIRFSEQMDATWPGFRVELDPQGDAGAPPIPFVGTFSKTYTLNDTWKGTVVVPVDASGNSDASLTDHTLDAVIRVMAQDLKDRDGNQRGLDADADGTAEVNSADVNHMIKLDAKRPVTSIGVRKTL